MHRDVIVPCFEIHAKHKCTAWVEGGTFKILKLVLHVVTTRPERLDLLKIFGEGFTNFSQPTIFILGRTNYPISF
jgi:hypothetical protein